MQGTAAIAKESFRRSQESTSLTVGRTYYEYGLSEKVLDRVAWLPDYGIQELLLDSVGERPVELVVQVDVDLVRARGPCLITRASEGEVDVASDVFGGEGGFA
jgi:restriction endonuclease Mrr